MAPRHAAEPYVLPEERPRRARAFAAWIPALVVAAVFLFGGAGTYAAFSATTSNPGTFATGTLVLSNTKDAETACLSIGNDPNTDDNANDCSALFSASLRKPGDIATADVTLENVGSIDATDLLVFAPATGCVDSDAEASRGAGSPCSSLRLTVQEFDSAARTTATTCWYGGGAGGQTCSFDATRTPAHFAATHVDALTDPVEAGPMASDDVRWFRISVELPATAGNAVQGRQASFGITWMLAQ